MQPDITSSLQRTLKNFFSKKRRDEILEFYRLVLRIGPVIGLFMLLEIGVRYAGFLAPESYQNPVLTVALIQRWNWWALPVVLLIVGFFGYRRSFGPSWPRLVTGQSIRIPLFALAVLLTWIYAFYDYNLYLDQGHYLDRILLIVLLALSCWRPVFLFPWLILLVAIMMQFNVPIGGYSTAEQFQLIRILLLFLAFLIIRVVTGQWRTSDFFFLLFCLVASGYWWSGLGKIRIDWFGYGPHLNHLLFATYANGWLGFLDSQTISRIGQAIVPLIWPMMLFTTIIEVGSILILWRRQTLIFFLLGFTFFHFGVFTMSGIFFWKWVFLEVVLLVFLLQKRLDRVLRIYSLPHFALSVLLIGGSFIWFKPVNLSWLDSALSYVYRIEATDENGRKSYLHPKFFRPFDYQFTLTPFGFLVKEPQLVVVWGASHNRKVAEALLKASSAEEAFAIESTFGLEGYDPKQANRFKMFLTRFLKNWNRRQSKSSFLSLVQPLPQLWTFPGKDAFKENSRISRIVIYQVTTFFNRKEYREIRKRPVLELEIPITQD